MPETVRERMKFILVDTVDEVIAAALTPLPGDGRTACCAGEARQTQARPTQAE